jgi:hypothetical protein
MIALNLMAERAKPDVESLSQPKKGRSFVRRGNKIVML